MISPPRKQTGKGRTRTDDALSLFNAGREACRRNEMRPPVPTEDNCDEPEAMRFYGWMIERAVDIGKIIKELELAGARHGNQHANVKRWRHRRVPDRPITGHNCYSRT
jgi:hypothetical protein